MALASHFSLQNKFYTHLDTILKKGGSRDKIKQNIITLLMLSG
jgi:hypothetical protein